MNLAFRIRRLKKQLAPRERPDIPKTEYEFCLAFVEGRITPEDVDRRNPNHISWLATFAAILSVRLSSTASL